MIKKHNSYFRKIGTRYKFRVSAENRHGISQESQAVTTRMMEEGSLKNKVFQNFIS